MYMLLNLLLIHCLKFWAVFWYLQVIETKQPVVLLTKFQKCLNDLGNIIQTTEGSMNNLTYCDIKKFPKLLLLSGRKMFIKILNT